MAENNHPRHSRGQVRQCRDGQRLGRIHVEKSAYHQQSHNEIRGANPLLPTPIRVFQSVGVEITDVVRRSACALLACPASPQRHPGVLLARELCVIFIGMAITPDFARYVQHCAEWSIMLV